jgi:hypothetical protein
VAEGDGLENRFTLSGDGGSNPSCSVMLSSGTVIPSTPSTALGTGMIRTGLAVSSRAGSPCYINRASQQENTADNVMKGV